MIGKIIISTLIILQSKYIPHLCIFGIKRDFRYIIPIPESTPNITFLFPKNAQKMFGNYNIIKDRFILFFFGLLDERSTQNRTIIIIYLT